MDEVLFSPLLVEAERRPHVVRELSEVSQPLSLRVNEFHTQTSVVVCVCGVCGVCCERPKEC